MKQPVTVIGIGSMGAALASAFHAAGHPTTVWNRTPGKATALVATGVTEADSAVDAVLAGDLIIMCVKDYPAAHAVLAPVTDRLPGRAVVGLNTGDPESARQTAKWVTERGADYLDGAIMAVPQGIGLPETQIFYSGNQRVFDAHRDTLRALAGETVHLGDDPGAAVLFEAAIGAILVPSLWGFLHGAAMLRTVGEKAETLLPHTLKYLTNVIAPTLPIAAHQIDTGDYDSQIASIALFAEMHRHETDSLTAMGLDDGVPQAFQSLFDRAVKAGHGPDSVARLIDVMARRGRD